MTMLKHILIEHGLEEGLKILTDREQQVLSLYYLAGFCDEEIANSYGIKRQNINRLRIKGLTKLKNIKDNLLLSI